MKFRPAPWSRFGLVLVVIASWAASVPAVAQSASLAVLGLSTKDGDDEPAAALTGALRNEAAADASLTVSESSALLSQLLVLHDCEIADADCRNVIARQLDVDELIYGGIRRSDAGHKVELHRYAVASGRLSHASRELTIEGASDAALAKYARGLLRELRPSKAYEEPVVAPAPVPERKRAARPVPLPEPHEEPEPEPEPDDEVSSNDWLGYSLLGVAAVSVGLTVFSWSEIDAAANDADLRAFREAVGRTQTGAGVDDVCDEAAANKPYTIGVARLANVRDACDRAATFEVLQWVFMGTALVSAGVGTYFLLDDEGEPDTARASIVPMLGKDDAGLMLRLQL